MLAHANGHVTRYLHLKKNSIAVTTGNVVFAGQQIGLTGSSGISTGPHLHFQTEIDGAAIEPFTGPQRPGKSMWQFQPTNETSTYTYVREFTLVPTSLGGWPGPPEPTANTGTCVRSDTDQTIFLWWYLINRPANTTYTLTTRRPNGSIASFTTGSFEAPSRSGWIWRARSLLLDEIGTWYVDLARSHRSVRGHANGFRCLGTHQHRRDRRLRNLQQLGSPQGTTDQPNGKP